MKKDYSALPQSHLKTHKFRAIWSLKNIDFEKNIDQIMIFINIYKYNKYIPSL